VIGARSKKTRRSRSAPEGRYRAVVLAGSVLVCSAAVAATAAFGLSRLWRGITQMGEFRLRPVDELRFDGRWIREEAFRAHLCAVDPTGTLDEECSVFDSRLAERVAAACEASPYVRRVRSVSKVFPNHLRMLVSWRLPYALLHCTRTGRYYVVDEDGVVLSPQLYDLTPARLEELLPVVEVSGTRSLPVPGRTWDEVAVREGVAMMRLYRTQLADVAPLRKIEVEGIRDPAEDWARAWMVLAGGARVYWGRTPSSGLSIAEPPPEEKVAALRAIVEKEGEDLGKQRVIYLNLRQPRAE